jgi:hypothetical protein
MYPHRTTVQLHLRPAEAEIVYWELIGLLSHYEQDGPQLDPADESALRLTANRLEFGLKQAQALADLQLQQLRQLNNREASK